MTGSRDGVEHLLSSQLCRDAGPDFDLGSLQTVGNDIWFGDEFGPWLIRVNKDGKVLAVYETRLDGKVLRSPDHPANPMRQCPAR